jgi:primary-amine oxidase
MHPLDPLTATEISTAAQVLKEEGWLGDSVRVGTVELREPQKTQDTASAPEPAMPREAIVLLYDWATGQSTEAVVDVTTARVVSATQFPAGDPLMRSMIAQRANEVLRQNAEWTSAISRRGIVDLQRVLAIPGVRQGSGIPSVDGDRVVGVSALLREGSGSRILLRGLTARVNLTKGETVSVLDTGEEEIVPLSEREPPPRPAAHSGGHVFLTGREVRWGPWDFRFGVHPRRGLELFEVRVSDGGNLHSLLYRASVSEIVTPYGDPFFGSWAPRDLVDYGLGTYMPVSLIPGSDVPADATFVEEVLHDSLGAPVSLPNAVAVYERDMGALWRHGSTARREKQLVVTSAFQVDNYDYIFNWIFSEDATLTVEAVLTGVVNFSIAKPEAIFPQDQGPGVALHRRQLAPGIFAPIHQHFFSYRLDFDIDTPSHNSVLEMNTMAEHSGDDPSQTEWFTYSEQVLSSERDARRRMDLSSGRTWRVINTQRTNAWGQRVGYEIVPEQNAIPMPGANSPSGKKARFAAWHIWVTPFRREEIYAGGRYQGTDFPGLSEWSEHDRSVADTDVVLWYTLGLNHLPRPEEWPIMSRHAVAFKIVPYGFFDQNPAITQGGRRP